MAKAFVVKCPSCASPKIWKNGYDHSGTQRYLCRDCSVRFSSRTFFHKSVKDPSHIPLCQIGVPNGGSKNLALVKRKEKDEPAGATTDSKGLIVDHAFWLKKNGYADSTIDQRNRILRRLVRRGVDLLDPESVKEVIANQSWNDSGKKLVASCYTTFLKSLDLKWTAPRYRAADRLPFIPLEKEIDNLIAACSNKLGTFLQLLKETGARPGESWYLKWIDIDHQRRTIRINTPEKGSNARILPITAELVAKISRLSKDTDYIFRKKPDASLHYWTVNFGARRRSIARKLNNPRIKKISFKTLRHWKATMEYHKTKDIIHVKKILGHKHIENTMVYINLEAALFQTTNDQFTVRVAEKPEEIKQLLEVGFEFVCEKDGLQFFRKPR